MQHLELVFLREVVRLHHRELGFAKKADVKGFLEAASVPKKEAHGYIYNQGSVDKLLPSSEILLRRFVDHQSFVLDAMVEAGNEAAAGYLRAIIQRHHGNEAATEVSKQPIANTIAERWLASQGRGNKVLRTGVYQVFRRYKPTHIADEAGTFPDDAIVVELLYVDSETLETVLVTSEGNLYWGSLHINHRSTLYGLMQRPHDLRPIDPPVSLRFYAVNIKQHGGRQRPLYSGLYIKTGDISELPLSGDCIFLQVPAPENPGLHERLRTFLHEPFAERNVSDDQLVMDYVVGCDEDGDVAPKLRIPNIAFIKSLLDESPDRDPLFRPPARALGSKLVTERAKGMPISVFRHSNARTDADPTLL